jgi:hypothetical protein
MSSAEIDLYLEITESTPVGEGECSLGTPPARLVELFVELRHTSFEAGEGERRPLLAQRRMHLAHRDVCCGTTRSAQCVRSACVGQQADTHTSTPAPLERRCLGGGRLQTGTPPVCGVPPSAARRLHSLTHSLTGTDLGRTPLRRLAHHARHARCVGHVTQRARWRARRRL